MITLPHRFGHYHLESLLGTGGMGEVYLAHDTQRDRKVALKLLPEVYGDDQEYLSRFKRESYVAARLRDPHVIPIHDFGEIDDRLFIDMRLVDGRDIRAILDQDGAIPPDRAVYLISQIAEALDAAHSDNLVHRDIKPSNVLVTKNDFVYVVDFGIARAIGPARTSLTITGTTVGSLDYMAPERFTNEPIDHRTDVYSLACLLHECLTGSRPFRGNDLPSLMYAHLFTDAPQASTVRPGIPPALDAVISRGMAKESSARYPSAGALAAAARETLATANTAHIPALAAPAETTVPALAANGSGPAVLARPGPARPSPNPRPATTEQPAPQLPPPPEVTTAPRRRRGLLIAVISVLTVVGVLVGLTAVYGNPLAANKPAVTQPAVAPEDIAASIAVPTVAGTVAVGPTPGYIEVAPNGRFAYICNRDALTVTVLDTTLNQVTATIAVPEGPPQFVSFSPDSSTAYVSVYNTERTINLVAFLDTATNTVTSTIPVGRRPFASSSSPDGRLLYVPSHDDGRIDVIDTTNASLVTQIPVAKNPHWVTFGRDGRFAYAANHESNLVTVLDAATNGIVAEIPVGKSPHSTAVSPDGTRVSVVTYDSNEVYVIDTATNAVVATVPVGAKPQDIAYAPDGRFLYVANIESDTISVINTASNKVTATIPSVDGPSSVSVRPDGTQAYVTNLNSGNVLILDLSHA